MIATLKRYRSLLPAHYRPAVGDDLRAVLSLAVSRRHTDHDRALLRECSLPVLIRVADGLLARRAAVAPYVSGAAFGAATSASLRMARRRLAA